MVVAVVPYSLFLSLLENIDKNRLFDAVYPEILAFRKNKYPNVEHYKAYRNIFENAFKSTGGEGEFPDLDYQERFAGMRKKNKGSEEYRSNIRYGHWFYYFTLFSKDCEDDPHYGERISETLFEQSFYDEFVRDMRRLGIPRPSHLLSLDAVRLGPITILLGHDNDLMPLSLREGRSDGFAHTDISAVFKALHWSSRLSSLHGRSNEYNRLINWALDKNVKAVKVMLVSGPGGIGKSRLVADVASSLVHKHGWTGGFLPRGAVYGDKLAADGNGVALIIDYPEERTEFVKAILAAAVDDTPYDRPIRILLPTRETIQDWRANLNDPNPERIEELRLDETRYLTTEYARQIIVDVVDTYSTRLEKSKPDIEGMEVWLAAHRSHRLPLISTAASIHAVIAPEEGFSLDGKDILVALAEIERRRTRSFSKREFGDAETLGRLLSIALLTPDGLFTDTIYSLGNNGLSSEISGDSFLRAVRRTPYWIKQNSSRPGHLVRLEPDRAAAAFLYLALELNDEPTPAMPGWFAIAAKQCGPGFVAILARLAMDLSYVNPGASQVIESLSTKMLEISPELVDTFRESITQKTPIFSAMFTLSICKKLLHRESNQSKKASILNKMGIISSSIRRYEDSLNYIRNSIAIRRELARSKTESDLDSLAISIQNLSNTLSLLSRYNEALSHAKEALGIRKKLVRLNRDKYLSDLAMSLSIMGFRLADLHKNRSALRYSRKAHNIYRELSRIEPSRYLSEFASSLSNLDLRLAAMSKNKKAVVYSEEAVSKYEVLSKNNPTIFLPELAASLDNLASRYVKLNRTEESIEKSEKSIEIYRDLVLGRRDVFLPGLALLLSNLGNRLAVAGRIESALEVNEEAISILRELAKSKPQQFSIKLAKSLKLYSDRKSRIGELEVSIPILEEAINAMISTIPLTSEVDKKFVLEIVGQYQKIGDEAGLEIDLALVDKTTSLIRTVS